MQIDDNYYVEIPTAPKRKPKAALMIKVLVFDNKTGECVRDHTKDYSSRKVKEWLVGVIMWALNNSKSIEIFALNGSSNAGN